MQKLFDHNGVRFEGRHDIVADIQALVAKCDRVCDDPHYLELEKLRGQKVAVKPPLEAAPKPLWVPKKPKKPKK